VWVEPDRGQHGDLGGFSRAAGRCRRGDDQHGGRDGLSGQLSHLLALGVPPVVANASNTTGLVPGGLSGTLGYRRELSGQGRRLRPLLTASLLGGGVGAGLLLVLPASAFEAVVPALVLLASVLVAVQPALSRRLRTRAASRTADGAAPISSSCAVSRPVLAAAGLLSVYGGYFGAGHGVILIALLALGLDEQLQVVNALKNAAVTAANAAAAGVFVTVGDLDWAVVALIALGSVVGGQLGARLGRRLPASVLRALVVAVGLVVAARLLLR
jgi:uncharacterized membrane protein YfcA